MIRAREAILHKLIPVVLSVKNHFGDRFLRNFLVTSFYGFHRRSDLRSSDMEVGLFVKEVRTWLLLRNLDYEKDIARMAEEVDADLQRAAGESLIGPQQTVDIVAASMMDEAGHSSLLSEIFECLLAELSYGAQNINDIITPPSVASLLAAIGEVKNDETVFDPVCGSGGILVEMAKYAETKNITEFQLFGADNNKDAATLARVRLALAGKNEAKIWAQDVLEMEQLSRPIENRKFDLIISNPPFSAKWNFRGSEGALKNEIFKHGTPPSVSADYAYLQRIIFQLKESGRAVILFSPGALSRGGAERNIREGIVRSELVEAIVQLPRSLFQTTSIAPCILVLRKEPSKDGILFADCSRRFSQLNRRRNVLSEEDIQYIARTIRERRDGDESRLVPFAEVVGKNFDLSVIKYVQSELSSDQRSYEELLLKQARLIDRLNELHIEMARLVR